MVETLSRTGQYLAQMERKFLKINKNKSSLRHHRISYISNLLNINVCCFVVSYRTIYLIQSSKLLSYSTSTFSIVNVFTTPNSTPIANIHVLEDDKVLIFTTTGILLTLEKNAITKTFKVNSCPTGWTPIMTFINFVHPSDARPSYPHYLALGYPQDSALPVLYSITGDGEIAKLCWAVVPSLHSIAVSSTGEFVVAIQEGSLYCKNMNDPSNCKWHKSGTRKLTCVAVHPTSPFVCATGDDSGRVLIWNDVMGCKSPAKTVFHWHTLPVTDLIFSPEGSNMYSGAGECTLVKWDINDSNNKRTLPRMGLPIAHLAVSSNSDLIAVSHTDNRIHLVDPYNKVTGVIRNFTCAQDSYSAGITIDPNSGCIIMNGRPGVLQAYDFNRNAHVYDIDVCNQNYVTAERDHAIPNATVTNVAFSNGGGWMATSERRLDIEGKSCSEFKLKFWKRNKECGVWVLNTCIEIEADAIRFRGGKDDDLNLISSCKKQFKVWGIVEQESVTSISQHWVNLFTRSYKNLNVSGVSYSSDGSLVAAAFERIVSVWDSEEVQLKLSLCASRLQENIRILEFGGNVDSHLLLACSASYTAVWDIITASLLWVVPVSLHHVGIDYQSGMVVGSSNVDLFLFKLSSPEVLRVFKQASKSDIKAVGWVKTQRSKNVVFLNGSDEVCGLLSGADGDEEEKVYVKEDNSRLTGFGVMVAEKRVSAVGRDRNRRDLGGVKNLESAYSILREVRTHPLN